MSILNESLRVCICSQIKIKIKERNINTSMSFLRTIVFQICDKCIIYMNLIVTRLFNESLTKSYLRYELLNFIICKITMFPPLFSNMCKLVSYCRVAVLPNIRNMIFVYFWINVVLAYIVHTFVSNFLTIYGIKICYI